MLKTVVVTTTDCVRCGGASGPEVIPGDTVQIFLDRDANPAFPEWIEGVIMLVGMDPLDPLGSRHQYTVEYDDADLLGSALSLRDCDIIGLVCRPCCDILNEYLSLIAGLNHPILDLSYQWVNNQVVGITARAYSTQVWNTPPMPVEIAQYVFFDPSGAEMPFAGADNYRTYVPVDTNGVDWPGGLFTVQVTDQMGLSSNASIWVDPKPRFVWRSIVLPASATSVDAGLAAGEKIISVLATSTLNGFLTFVLHESNPSVIVASLAPTNNLTLRVLVHIP